MFILIIITIVLINNIILDSEREINFDFAVLCIKIKIVVGWSCLENWIFQENIFILKSLINIAFKPSNKNARGKLG
jgi:hypothetical protein